MCNASKIRCSVAAIVAKSRTWFYFVQRLLQQKCCETWWLRGMLHHAISPATCVATKLRDRLHEKLHSVTPRGLKGELYSKIKFVLFERTLKITEYKLSFSFWFPCFVFEIFQFLWYANYTYDVVMSNVNDISENIIYLCYYKTKSLQNVHVWCRGRNKLLMLIKLKQNLMTARLIQVQNNKILTLGLYMQ